MKSLLNQSNAMFSYDGDYSYLHKEESASASKNSASNKTSLQNKMFSEEPLHETVFECIQLIKAKRHFYFSAMGMLILLNLFLILKIFHH